MLFVVVLLLHANGLFGLISDETVESDAVLKIKNDPKIQSFINYFKNELSTEEKVKRIATKYGFNGMLETHHPEIVERIETDEEFIALFNETDARALLPDIEIYCYDQLTPNIKSFIDGFRKRFDPEKSQFHMVMNEKEAYYWCNPEDWEYLNTNLTSEQLVPLYILTSLAQNSTSH